MVMMVEKDLLELLKQPDAVNLLRFLDLETIHIFNGTSDGITSALNQLGSLGLASEVFEIGLSDNGLEDLPENLFSKFTNLTFLDLSNNNFSGFKDGLFKGLGKLQRLRLNKNQLEVLSEDLFEDLRSLISLDLDKNNLVALPNKLLRNQGKLTRIFLRQNQLRSIPEDSFQGTALVLIDLASNDLEDLSFRLFTGLPVKSVWLNNNPLARHPFFNLELPADQAFSAFKGTVYPQTHEVMERIETEHQHDLSILEYAIDNSHHWPPVFFTKENKDTLNTLRETCWAEQKREVLRYTSTQADLQGINDDILETFASFLRQKR